MELRCGLRTGQEPPVSVPPVRGRNFLPVLHAPYVLLSLLQPLMVSNGKLETAIAQSSCEGTGVEPDVAVPATDALRIAHTRALERLLTTFRSGPWYESLSRTIKNHGQKFTLRLLKQLAVRGPVTLMCHCAEDETRCHPHELKKLIGSRQI